MASVYTHDDYTRKTSSLMAYRIATHMELALRDHFVVGVDQRQQVRADDGTPRDAGTGLAERRAVEAPRHTRPGLRLEEHALDRFGDVGIDVDDARRRRIDDLRRALRVADQRDHRRFGALDEPLAARRL